MVRARSFTNGTPAGRFRIPLGAGFSEKYHVGTLFRCCVLGQGTLPSHAILDSGVNDYLVGQMAVCVYFLAQT